MILRMSQKIFLKKSAWIITVFILVVFSLDRIFPPSPLKDYSKVIYDRNGHIIASFLTTDDKWRLRSKPSEIPDYFIKTIIFKEDRRFYYHIGFDVFSLVRAFIQNIGSGRIISGASTITMQTVRLLQPAERTYLNKFVEILRAVQMEMHYSKNEILQIYLSNLPFGGNIEGIKAASIIYLNREPSFLSLSQAAAFAVIPNNPGKLNPITNTDGVKFKRDNLLNALLLENHFPDEIINDALEESIQFRRSEFVNKAPHYSQLMKNLIADDVIKGSIDLRLQSSIQQSLSVYVHSLIPKKITNGALLVVHNQTGKAIVYIGSADFTDSENSGQVDGIKSVRSPGSTLKPFLFAKMIQQKNLNSQSTLYDIPLFLNGYEPENYDGTYSGKVTFSEALINSLNVPAVRMLDQYGTKKFINDLKNLGFESVAKMQDKLGLSLILGGCGVTLEELTKAYMCLANNGAYRAIEYSKTGGNSKKNEQFTVEGSKIISSILVSTERNDFPDYYRFADDFPVVAWKTGTSYGKRDAWALGYSSEYTVGVWFGNFSGEGSPFIKASEIAVPFMFDVFRVVARNDNELLKDLNETVHETEVCESSGMLPAEFCEKKVKVLVTKEFLEQAEICNEFREIYVSEDGKVSYCVNCLPANNYSKKYVVNQDPEYLYWLKKKYIYHDKIPPHYTKCKIYDQFCPPAIISPVSKQKYFLEREGRGKIALSAASPEEIKKHFWYVDGRLIGSGISGKTILFQPSEGMSEILCVDERGNSSSVSLEVILY